MECVSISWSHKKSVIIFCFRTWLLRNVIVYDRLANKNYLKEAKENCEFIYVGKASSNHTLPQDDINRVIADKAKEGKIVTRLKGGDPYVFGRGGE